MTGTAKHRVLIVDDERVISDTLFKIYTQAGYEARAVYSAEAAIELVRAEHWIPQFTLVDVNLPGMNGIDLAILLKAECPDCRISLFSGQAMTANLLASAEEQGHTFHILAKPVHPADLLNITSERLASGSVTPLVH